MFLKNDDSYFDYVSEMESRRGLNTRTCALNTNRRGNLDRCFLDGRCSSAIDCAVGEEAIDSFHLFLFSVVDTAIFQ